MNLAPALAKCGEISNEPMYHHSPSPHSPGTRQEVCRVCICINRGLFGEGRIEWCGMDREMIGKRAPAQPSFSSLTPAAVGAPPLPLLCEIMSRSDYAAECMKSTELSDDLRAAALKIKLRVNVTRMHVFRRRGQPPIP